MSEETWLQIEIGATVKKGDLVLTIDEICENERYTSRWGANTKRICRGVKEPDETGFVYHTWIGRFSEWELVK